MRSLDHLFLALGLSESNLETAAITGIAAVRTDRKGTVLAAYSESCSVRGLVDCDLEAVYGNMANALLKPFPAHYVIVAEHSNAYRTLLGPAYFKGKTWLDISQLAWPLGYSDMIPDRSLDTLTKHFGTPIAFDLEGTMSGNCEALVRVYWAMMKRYRSALIGEEAVRDFGGEALAGIRKFIGI